ncbi:MAG: flagellar export chaperone FliS [Candidatus Zixiibacteriota bacterium]|nr:MAG: flagellar export chaperone FliS [candidate division Zixibacteria bacterium]HHI03484.1 flagellar export chaperone FliS [candidate division Zixibacteria bacterium]
MEGKLTQYRKAEAESKSAPELIVMVYDGAISSLKKAAELYKAENSQDGREAMEKAKRFVVHLYTTLDEEKGGEVAANLSAMYAYLIERMNFIQATKDIETINNSIDILTNIREGWIGLADQVKSRQPKNGGNAVSPDRKKGLSISV